MSDPHDSCAADVQPPRIAATERTERLLKITAAIAEAVSDAEVYEATVDHVAAAVEASSAGLWLVDEDDRSARLVRSQGYAEAARQRIETIALDIEPRTPIESCVQRGEPVFIASPSELVDRYPNLRPIVTAGRSYRVMCLPLVARGRTLGGLGLTIEEAREATDDERNFLMLVARYASQAIERLRLFEAERRSRNAAFAAAARLEVLGHASRAFVETSLDLRSTLATVASEVGTVLGSTIIVSLVEADGRIHTAAVHHPVPAARELLQAIGQASPTQLGEGFTGTVVRTGQSLFIPSVDPAVVMEGVAPAYRTFLERHPIYAAIATPLRTRGRIIGSIGATRNHPGETYTHADLQMLQDLADRAAAAIENSRLYQEVVDARARAEQLLGELRETIRYNETFAGILGHDLRNPLGAIMTAAKLLLLRQGGEGDKISKPLSRIVSSGERMTRMIEQLLDLTRARVGGGIEVHPQEADLAELCSHVMDELELVHPEWRLAREVRGDTSGAWDPDRLLQVVSNLVTNAGVHGDRETGVRVRIDGTSSAAVVLEIHNEGAIPASLLPDIFDPFRGTRHRREQSQGLGLGLFITQQVVQAHGGTIEVHSTEAEGTTFVVRLPRRATPRGPARADGAAAS